MGRSLSAAFKVRFGATDCGPPMAAPQCDVPVANREWPGQYLFVHRPLRAYTW